jgi:hypothetical protein
MTVRYGTNRSRTVKGLRSQKYGRISTAVYRYGTVRSPTNNAIDLGRQLEVNVKKQVIWTDDR